MLLDGLTARLVAVLYELLCPGRKFCSSFFQLAVALLESMTASLQQGREQCANAAVDLAALMAKALKQMAEDEQLSWKDLKLQSLFGWIFRWIFNTCYRFGAKILKIKKN